ncbi:hypothetical protein C7448_10918 [Tenacibaculum gallaicum]|uniref:Uncharacterized protein n=1 Tax=Tenacibaculum gallaicum TaxID=561505 RepID=A0A3E0HH68_9FLAO|nr:hypothetical protein C7448_10918 [Tenacibaculum gallaicum]
MYLREKYKVSSYLEFEEVRVFCLLSIDETTLPKANTNTKNGLRIYRSIAVNREEIEVSTVFTD